MGLGYRWYSVKLWFRERPDKIAWWLAQRLPRKVALYAFVRVAASPREAPGPEYEHAYKVWEAGHGR